MDNAERDKMLTDINETLKNIELKLVSDYKDIEHIQEWQANHADIHKGLSARLWALLSIIFAAIVGYFFGR